MRNKNTDQPAGNRSSVLISPSGKSCLGIQQLNRRNGSSRLRIRCRPCAGLSPSPVSVIGPPQTAAGKAVERFHADWTPGGERNEYLTLYPLSPFLHQSYPIHKFNLQDFKKKKEKKTFAAFIAERNLAEMKYSGNREHRFYLKGLFLMSRSRLGL